MADEVIGRADYVLGVDNTGVKAGVAESEQLIKASGATTEAAAESSAYKTGVAIGNGIKLGVKVVATAATAMFAIATKGALELNQVQADYTAETGATADEANRAAKAINEMAGRNIQPLAEIGKTAAKVRTDLGLVGDEANTMTEAFLRFARATKQDAAGAVVAFDDILDSWGLTAKDAQAIMDKLIVSHQRYGGSIEDNQRALAQLAPQLRSLNLTIDDGIGLLNLFASSGLDASAAQTALNTAITKLPKGESLQDFLVRLSHVTDDGQRAQLAMEVFGQKAGAKLANAIRPGIASIDSFKVSTQEATGATEKAADALDDTFGARAQLMFNKFASTLRGLGADWGPLLTGAASAGSLLTSIFGEEAIRRLGPKFVSALKSVGQQGGDALMDGMQSVWTGAGGTVAGNFIASRIEAMVDSSKNSRIAEGIRVGAAKAGALWGLIFSGAQGLVSTLYSGIAGAIAESAAAPAIRAAILAAALELGTLQGTTFASAVAAAALAAPIVIPIAIVIAGANGQLPGQDPRFKAALDQGIIDLRNRLTVGGIAAGTEGGQATAEAYGDAMVDAWRNRPIGDKITAAIEIGLAASTPKAAKAITLFTRGIFGSDLAAQSDYALAWARRLGNLAGGGVAKGILDKRSEVDQAWQSLLDMIKNSQSVTAETARLLGELASKSLIKGLHSADPATRAQARYTKQLIIDQLEELRPRAGTLSKEAMENLRKAMKSKDPDIRAAARSIYDAATHPIAAIVPKGTTYGQNFGQNFADGISSKAHAAEVAAMRLAGAVGNYLKISSPSKLGPFSTLGGPEGWGRRLIDFYSRGIEGGLPGLNRTLQRGLSLGGMSLQGMNPTFLGQLAGGVSRGTATTTTTVRHGDVSIGAIHLHGVGSDVSPAAASRFARNVQDEVALMFRQQGARRGVHPAVG